jgi:hypothetical protein
VIRHQPPAAVALVQCHEVAAAHLYHPIAGFEVDLEIAGHHGAATFGEHQHVWVRLDPSQDLGGLDELGPARDAGLAALAAKVDRSA